MQGRIFTDPSCPELSPAERRRVYQAFPATLAALHSVRPADVGLLSYGRAGGYAKRQVPSPCCLFWTRPHDTEESSDTPWASCSVFIV